MTTASATTAPVPGAAISILGLRKSYGDKHAVDGLDLEIPEGRGLRAAGAQWRWQDHHDRDPRGLPQADLWRGARTRRDPRDADRDWRTQVGVMLQSTSDRSFLTAREAPGPRRQAVPPSPRRRRDARGRRPHRRRTPSRRPSRAVSAGASTWPWPSWGGRALSSLMADDGLRPPRRAASSGGSSRASAATAPPSCSPLPRRGRAPRGPDRHRGERQAHRA